MLSDNTAASPPNVFKTDTSTLDEKDDLLRAPPQDLTSTSHLTFWHRFNMEDGFDGGVLEVSTDGGATWVDVLAGGGSFVAGGYNGTISTGFDSRIAGRQAWTGFSQFINAMNMVDVDLGAFAGPGRLVRWRFVADPIAVGSLPGETWSIDDVEFTNPPCDNTESSACTLPGIGVLSDRDGDIVTPVGQTSNAGWDLRRLSIAEPYDFAPARLVFTLKVENLSVVPANTRWPIQFKVPSDPATLGRWVDMRSNAAGAVSFKFGTFTINPAAAPNAQYGAPNTVVGDADAGSAFSADGTIRIVVSRSKVGDPAVGATLSGFLIRVRVEAPPAAAVTPDNMPNNFSPGGLSYTLVGNNPFCRPNTAPILDSLAADPGSGTSPLLVTLTGAAHDNDTQGPDPADTIASYTFGFGDGAPAETRTVAEFGAAASTATHTYSVAGCPHTFSASLSVTDSRGKPSASALNVPVTVAAPNRAPEATLAVTPPGGDTLDTITLDASGSSEPDSGCDAIASYTFDFGDGSAPITQTDPVARHVYSIPGVYTATVTVADTRGGSGTATRQITITPVQNRAPVAVLSAEPTEGVAPISVSFDAGSSFDPDATRTGDTVVQYDFDFGDGTTETLLAPNTTTSHSYTLPGTYNVLLRVFDSNGLASAADALVQIEAFNSPPVAALTPSATEAPKNSPVTLDASGSTDANGDAIVEYVFDPGDGSGIVVTAASQIAHAYTRGGTYVASVRVRDARGDLSLDAATASLTITNTAPVATLAATPQSGVAPLLVEFDAAGSFDPDTGDSVVSYTFDFGDGSAPVTRVGATTAQHLYSTAGPYTATITVQDEDGTASAPVSILITVASANRAPVARLSASPRSGEMPLAVVFDASASSDTDGDAVEQYTFDFGDGTAPVTQAAANVSHTYAGAGRYLAVVTVRDARGAQSSNSDTVAIVVETPAAVSASAPAFEDSKGPFGGALPPLTVLLLMLGRMLRFRHSRASGNPGRSDFSRD